MGRIPPYSTRNCQKNNINGQITNLEGYDVQIVAEGRYDFLTRFKSDIIIQDYPILVENIEVSEEPCTGEYSCFQVVRGAPEEELAERFDSALAIFSRMERKQDYSIGLQKETIGLQKETLDEVKGIRQDLHKTITQEIAEVRIELREMRSALIQAGIMKNAFS